MLKQNPPHTPLLYRSSIISISVVYLYSIIPQTKRSWPEQKLVEFPPIRAKARLVSSNQSAAMFGLDTDMMTLFAKDALLAGRRLNKKSPQRLNLTSSSPIHAVDEDEITWRRRQDGRRRRYNWTLDLNLVRGRLLLDGCWLGDVTLRSWISWIHLKGFASLSSSGIEYFMSVIWISIWIPF